MTIFRTWWILFGLQVLVALVVFSPFLTGQAYFAYFDIGSDSYFQVLPDAMHMARKLAAEGFTGWSFEFGLGGPTALLIGDTLGMLHMLGGPEHVAALRIWVYLFKIILGGTFFLLFVRHMVDRWETAVICALAYSFCGFMVINGQWDIEATEFVFYPVILWAIMSCLRTGNVIVLPLAVAFVVGSSVFFVVSTGIFIAFTGLAFVFTSSEPRTMFKKWVFQLLPLIALGYLLSAPRLLPLVMQVLDSSRVSGGDNLFQKIASESLGLNSWPLVLIQIGGLFHKDIFGIGSAYKGYQNYLEGPGFYVGVTFLLLIPQLWKAEGNSRRLLWLGLLIACAYFVFPLFRNLALGFSAPYFRVSTLWISLVLLLLAAKAVDQVIKNGVNGRLLLFGFGSVALLLLLVVQGSMGANVVKPHVIKILGVMLIASLLLLLVCRAVLSLRLVPLVLLMLVVIETVLIARPSYIEGRSLVTPEIHAHAYNDGTLEALQAIRQLDTGVFRIEKTYDSVSLADSLAQNYMGLKSYYLHSRGLVDFYVGLGLIPPPSGSRGINYTNWLPNAGPRFMLNSLLGVKYIITRTLEQWPGFVSVGNVSGLQVYRNDMALPLGVVQTKQITKKELADLSLSNDADVNAIRDIVMINAVVVERFIPGSDGRFALEDLLRSKEVSIEEQYFEKVKVLQAEGMKILSFSSNRIVGTIKPVQEGMLVFSIPFNQGWALKIDGQTTPLIRANFGMLAAPVQAGAQTVELDFQLPGQRFGLLIGAFGLMLFGLLVALNLRYIKRLSRTLE